MHSLLEPNTFYETREAPEIYRYSPSLGFFPENATETHFLPLIANLGGVVRLGVPQRLRAAKATLHYLCRDCSTRIKSDSGSSVESVGGSEKSLCVLKSVNVSQKTKV